MLDLKLFAGSSNIVLAKNLARSLAIPLAKSETTQLSGGELRVRILEDVKGKTCVILQSLSQPVEKNWVELLFFLDALKRGGAGKIICFVPWLGYQKQDRQFRSGETISVAVVAKTLEEMGMDQLITFDLHNPTISNYFKNAPLVLSAFPLFLEEIKKIVAERSDFVMVAPDKGAYWATDFAKKLEIGLVKVEKERDQKTGKILKALKIKGDVKGKTAIIVDDVIYTGATLILNAKLLKEKGAKKVICFATHGNFCKDTLRKIEASQIDRLIITDTIIQKMKIPKLKIISSADTISEIF